MHVIWDKYPEIKKELSEIIHKMDKDAACKDKVIQESIRGMIHSNGKMIRPALVVLASKFGTYNPEKARALGAVVEMFHMATLVHDDIIDDATLRRGEQTVQSRYGKAYAVYIGDYLFCLCFKQLAEHASLQSVQLDSLSMSRICLGEVEQLNARFNKEVSVKHYLKRVSGKTAELFSLSLFIGATESGCDKRLSRTFWQIGHHMGMAFQIIDDLLDYTGDTAILGKDAANDLTDGIYNLPLIYALEKKPKDLLALLDQETYTKEAIQEIIRLTGHYGGIEQARKLADKYTKKAYKLIDKLPDNEYKTILSDVVEMLLGRNY